MIKAEIKARESLSALQAQTVSLEELLQEKKIEYETWQREAQEHHESSLDELKTIAEEAAEEHAKLLSDCHRKLERAERQYTQEMKRRDDINADLERRIGDVLEELEPANHTIAELKVRNAQSAQQIQRLLSASAKQREEETRLSLRLETFEKDAALHRRETQALKKEIATTLEEIHEKRLLLCSAELEMQQLRGEAGKWRETYRADQIAHTEQVDALKGTQNDLNREIETLKEDLAAGARKAEIMEQDRDEAMSRLQVQYLCRCRVYGYVYFMV